MCEAGLVGLGEVGQLGRVAGGEGAQVVDVHADDMIRVDAAQLGRDDRAGVAALGPVAVVAEAVHQLGPGLGHPAGVPAWPGERRGEAEAGQRRRDDMEGVGRVAAVASGVGQRADDFDELDDRAWPAVGDDQRQRARFGRADVQEVHVLAVDDRRELGELVQPGLLGAPVISVAQYPARSFR